MRSEDSNCAIIWGPCPYVQSQTILSPHPGESVPTGLYLRFPRGPRSHRRKVSCPGNPTVCTYYSSGLAAKHPTVEQVDLNPTERARTLGWDFGSGLGCLQRPRAWSKEVLTPWPMSPLG